MAKVNSINTIEVYELNGSEVNNETISIENHWNRKEFVVIIINNQKLTVLASDLIKAIENSQNV